MTVSSDDRALLAQAAYQELARRNLLDYCSLMDPNFISARHLELIAGYLERLERREIRKLAVTMPPRHGKTRLISQLFASWYLGKHPDHDIILASYGSELAEGNSRAVRTLVTDDRFPFPDVGLREDSRSVGRWETRQGATLIAASVSSGITGRGFACGICDDLVKGRDEAESEAIRASTRSWFSDVFLTRAAPDAIQIMVGTRWNAADIMSEVIDREGWVTLNLPLISEGDGDRLSRPAGMWLWPERFGPNDIPSVDRGEISSKSFSALYQQAPTPQDGLIIRHEWLKFYKPNELPDHFDKVVCGLDAAAKTGIANDHSALITVGVTENRYYVIDLALRRVEFPELRRMTVAAYEKHSPSAIYIEDTSNATALIQELRRESRLPVVAVQARGSKISRVEGTSGCYESGRVFIPESSPFTSALVAQLVGFPGGCRSGDDAVDALTIVLRQLRRARSELSWAFVNTDPFALR